MKIAIISLYLPTGLQGGVPVQVHELSNEMVRRNHSVTVFSLYPKPAEALYHVKTTRLSPFFQKRVNHVKGLGIYVFPWFLRHEDFSAFDVIHAHGDSHFVRSARPVVRTFHSSGIDEALRARSLRQFLGLMGIYPWEWISGLRATRCVFTTSTLKRYFPGLVGDVIPNAVDLSRFKPSAEKSAEPSILFVAGTLKGRKRGQFLIDQFQKQVLPREPKATLWMVCPEAVRGNHIVGWGTQSTERLIELYQKAWIFCLPSSHENFGVPYIEALACGTPVVTTPNDGARAVLGNDTYGVLVKPEHLGKTLADLLDRPIQRKRMADQGLVRAEQYSLKRVADQYEKLYRELSARS